MVFVKTDILNPYKNEIVSTDSYPTLIDFLQDKYPTGFERHTDLSINGVILSIDDYDAVLNDKDVIVLLDRPALPVGLIGGWFVTALANLAISVALTYISNKLFAPDGGQDNQAPSSVYNINNAQNIARFGSPIPIIYGKVRMYPAMIVQPYFKFENNIEYLYHVLCVSQGTCTTDEVLISNDSITSTGDLDWKLLYKYDFYDIPKTGFGVHVTNTLTNPSNMEIEVGDGESEKYTIRREAEFIEFDYMYPNGLIYYESDGETTAIRTEFNYKIYTESDGIYTQVGSESFYMNVSNVDPIQITKRIDVSAYDEQVYISFEKTLNAASSFYVTNTFIKRVKEIFPNEDFTQAYGDITVLACKIKATNAVSSAGQVKVNGYFERTDVGNLMHEVVTDIYTNTRYGAALDPQYLDFPVTTETVDGCYETSMTVFDAMRRPAIAQGYSVYLAGMDVIMKKDAPNNVTSGMYNELNILSNTIKAQYLFKEEAPSYDGFECSYIDGDGWTQQVALYPANSIRPQKVDLFGVVDWNIPPPSYHDLDLIITSPSIPLISTNGIAATYIDNGDGTWHVFVDDDTINDFEFQAATKDMMTKVVINKTPPLNNVAGLFSQSKVITEIDMTGIRFDPAITDVGSFFRNCEELLTIDTSAIPWSNILDCPIMFSTCLKLTCISKIDTRAATNKTGMFRDCIVLTSPDPLTQTTLEGASGGDYEKAGGC